MPLASQDLAHGAVAATLQQGLHLAHEHLGAHRFGDVVIRARLEARDLAVILAARGEEGDRRVLHVGHVAQLVAHTSTPSMPGIMMSRTIRSGRTLWRS